MAWPAPGIQAWTSFASLPGKGTQWRSHASQLRAGTALWAEIIGREHHLATVLEAPRQRLAAMAMRAHELLCSYAPAT